MIKHYEVHWARANQADKVTALRAGARYHATEEGAEEEARSLTPPRPDLVALVVECTDAS